MYGLWRIREEPGGEAKFLRAVVRMFSQFVEVSKAQLGTMLPDTRFRQPVVEGFNAAGAC